MNKEEFLDYKRALDGNIELANEYVLQGSYNRALDLIELSARLITSSSVRIDYESLSLLMKAYAHAAHAQLNNFYGYSIGDFDFELCSACVEEK